MLLQCRSFVKPFVTEATGERDVEVVGLYVVPDVAAHALLATNSAHICLPRLPVVRQQVRALRDHQPQLLLQIMDVCENFLTIPHSVVVFSSIGSSSFTDWVSSTLGEIIP